MESGRQARQKGKKERMQICGPRGNVSAHTHTQPYRHTHASITTRNAALPRLNDEQTNRSLLNEWLAGLGWATLLPSQERERETQAGRQAGREAGSQHTDRLSDSQWPGPPCANKKSS
mmetsp:Transcript_10753/g.31120  ORF Transcript_10753/g.31120 Transcript_10753/m.31120 type:complete len:118 (-) Transcript_10753:126-479(-)